jgi:hypothetical protein
VSHRGQHAVDRVSTDKSISISVRTAPRGPDKVQTVRFPAAGRCFNLGSGAWRGLARSRGERRLTHGADMGTYERADFQRLIAGGDRQRGAIRGV